VLIACAIFALVEWHFSGIIENKDTTIHELENRPSAEGLTKKQNQITELQAKLAQNESPEVYTEFVPVYQMYSGELGHPIGKAQTWGPAYQAKFEHGIILWLAATSTIYILPEDQPDDSVIERPDEAWTMDRKFFYETNLRNLFPSCRRPN
jgi:hypothetical protein